MAGKRRRYGAGFKAKVALKALKGELTIAQLVAKHGVAATLLEGDTDADGDALAVAGVWNAVNGTVSLDDKPATGEVVSSDAEDIACWFIDTDYTGESFFVRQAYFPGAEVPYKALRTTLKGEIDEDAWESLKRTISRPFSRPSTGRIAVKVINHLGDEVMKVLGV